MTALARNFEGEIVGLWYNNSECMLALAAEMLAIHKACLICYNFLGREVPIKSDCKDIVEALLRIADCL